MDTGSLVTGLVIGGVVGFVVGYLTRRPTVTCDSNHLIRVTANTESLPSTCAYKSQPGNQIQWQGDTGLTLALTIPDPPGGSNPYPSPTANGTQVVQSGPLVAGTIPVDTSIPYSLTVNGPTGSHKIYGHIIIKP
jgi:hypothetical protein